MSSYVLNECFYSLQGEGVRAGTANVFVRFAGCNLKCRVEPGPLSPGGFDCDTEFTSGVQLDAAHLVAAILTALPPALRAIEHHRGVGVIFTGGEPGLQLDAPLVQAVREEGFYTAIETNGTVDVTDLGLDWITVSPKVAEHALRQLSATEVKYVRHAGQGIPKPAIAATHYLLSPAAGPEGVDPEALTWCLALCKAHPRWRLSVQQHKSWRIR